MLRFCVALVFGMAAASPCTLDLDTTVDPPVCKASCNGATFDLSTLHSQGSYHVADKEHADVIHNYTYVFNICGNTIGGNNGCPTSYGTGDFFGKACFEDDGNGKCTPAPVFQVAQWYDGCYRLGADVRTHGASARLADPADASRGVVISYSGGSSCGSVGNRTFSLQLDCKNDVYNIPDREPVDETLLCQYEIAIESASGCPLECGRVDGELCNNKGVCRFDTDLGQARCFCSEGYEGNACQGASASSSVAMTPVAVTLVIILSFMTIFLVGLLVVIILLWFKIKSLRLDPTAYTSLAGMASSDAEAERGPASSL